MSIKAVIFDADGVVIFPWRFAEYLAREHKITREMILDFFEEAFKDCLVGKADLRVMLPPFLAKWGWEGPLEDFLIQWFEIDNAVDERVLQVIHSLRESEITCCLATNQERYRVEYMRTVMGFETIFDRLFFSSELGLLKPDPEFFRVIERSLNLGGQNILFWDDSPRNVESARRCGWHAEVYAGFEDFEKELDAYLG